MSDKHTRPITHTNELPRSVFEDLNRLPDARYLDYSEREVDRACHYAEKAADAGHSDTGASSSLKRRAGWSK